jgi:hypothetical protein
MLRFFFVDLARIVSSGTSADATLSCFNVYLIKMFSCMHVFFI